MGRARGDQQILPQLRGAAEKLSKGTFLTCVCSRLTADVEFNYCTELFWLFVFTGAFVYWKRDLEIFPTILRLLFPHHSWLLLLLGAHYFNTKL